MKNSLKPSLCGFKHTVLVKYWRREKGRRIPLETVRYFFRSLICALNIVIGLEHVFSGDLEIENNSRVFQCITYYSKMQQYLNDKFKAQIYVHSNNIYNIIYIIKIYIQLQPKNVVIHTGSINDKTKSLFSP